MTAHTSLVHRYGPRATPMETALMAQALGLSPAPRCTCGAVATVALHEVSNCPPAMLCAKCSEGIDQVENME